MNESLTTYGLFYFAPLSADGRQSHADGPCVGHLSRMEQIRNLKEQIFSHNRKDVNHRKATNKTQKECVKLVK